MERPPQRTLPAEFPGAAWYGEEELEAVTRVVRNQSPFRYYGTRCGFEAQQFESEFARYLASEPGASWPETSGVCVTGVNSGNGALEIALDALGVGCGDEVAVQGFMWVATISAIVRARAIPVLVDSDETLNMDPEALRQAITPRTKVVMPVPMLGGCARIGAIMDVVREANRERLAQGHEPIRVLEDAAQALGAHAWGAPGPIEPRDKEGVHRVGLFGDVGIFSLQLNKDITTGEGGAVVTQDPALHQRIEALHNVGFGKGEEAPRYWYGDIPMGWGHGRRMTELQGALARAQLQRLDTILANMRRSHGRFEDFLRKRGLKPRPRACAGNPGDTGYYCIFQLPPAPGGDEAKIVLGRKFAAALDEWGLHPWFLHDYEAHVYYNIPQLVEKQPIANGCPWDCEANRFHAAYSYGRGALPNLDAQLVTHVGFNVPSRLTAADEDHIIAVLDYVCEFMHDE